MFAAALILLLMLAFGLRLLPARDGVVGVDAWYYLAYAAALRRGGRLPARLPQYLLADDEQRYPPLFPWLLARLRSRTLERARSGIAPGIDAVHLLLLTAFAYASGMGPAALLLSVLVYATTPDLAHEYGTLSPRSLASLWLTAFVWPMALVPGGGTKLLILATLAAAAMLLTHKMGAQILLVVALALAGAERAFGPVVAVALALPCAWVFSRGLYAGVLRAHGEILAYWRRNIGWRGAHPVYDSPIHAAQAPDDWRSTRIYGGGTSRWRILRVLLARNPWALLAAAALLASRDASERTLLVWFLAVYATATLTLFVPPLRFLGEGFRYLKFAAFPVALLVARHFASWRGVPFVAAALLVSAYAIHRLLRARPLEVLDGAFEDLVEVIRHDACERVAVLPTHCADALAYLSGKKVLWGGHSSGYERLEQLVPVLRCPLGDLLVDHRIDLLVLDGRYVRADLLAGDSRFRPAGELGRYVLFARAESGAAEG